MTRRVEPLELIARYYPAGSLAYEILVEHSKMVTQKALAIALNLDGYSPDMEFIAEAAMLHDIGICLTDAPSLGCFGDEEYVCHGYLGRELLEKQGLPLHALVSERHTGAGISVFDIEEQDLPLPVRDMLPLSIEEKIICYADKFYTKKLQTISDERSLLAVRTEMARYGQANLSRFEALHEFCTG